MSRPVRRSIRACTDSRRGTAGAGGGARSSRPRASFAWRGPFGVDGPVGAAELIEPRGEGGGLGQGREGAGEAERALGEGAAEGVEVLAAEDGRQGADGKEKPRRRGDPARAVGGQSAAGDDTVQVEVLGEILSPG